jgi:nitrate reductase beta subunit
MGVLLYDADRIEEIAKSPDEKLVSMQRDMILNPNDPDVVAKATENGIPNEMIQSATSSPVYKFVKEWQMALPLHPEFRTLPMLYYIPPMLPVMSSLQSTGSYRMASDFFSSLENARLPLRYLAGLFAAGNESEITAVYKKLIAVRLQKRTQSVGDVTSAEANKALSEAGLTAEEAEAIYRLTSLPTFEERLVIPPMAREIAIEQTLDPATHKTEAGFGFRKPAKRRW